MWGFGREGGRVDEKGLTDIGGGRDRARRQRGGRGIVGAVEGEGWGGVGWGGGGV